MQAVHFRLDKGILHGNRPFHQLVQAAVTVVIRREIQAGCGIGLRISVYDKYLLLQGGERRGQINGRGGLAYPTLLIGNSYYFTHSMQKYEIILTFAL